MSRRTPEQEILKKARRSDLRASNAQDVRLPQLRRRVSDHLLINVSEWHPDFSLINQVNNVAAGIFYGSAMIALAWTSKDSFRPVEDVLNDTRGALERISDVRMPRSTIEIFSQMAGIDLPSYYRLRFE